MTDSALKRRALKGVTWAAIGGNGAQVLAFVFFVLISRVVGPEAFGAVAVSLLLIEIARVFSSECVAVNLVSGGTFDRGQFNAGFCLSLGMAVLIGAGLFFSAGALSAAFHIEALRVVLPQIAPILPVIAMSRLFEAALMLRMEFRPLAIRSLAGALLGGVVGIVAAYSGQGVEALVLQQWAAAGISLLLLGAQARWRPGFDFSREQFFSLARQSAALSPANLITNLRQTFDGLAIASFAGAATAGIYNFAKRTRLALQLGLSTAITRVSLPTFAHLKDEPARLASALNQSMGLAAIVAFPVFIGIGAIAPELIDCFLGRQWHAAAWPMSLLMVGGAIAITTRLSENMLLICERRGLIIAVNAVALALLIVAILATGRLGPAVVAAAVSIEGILHDIAAWAIAARVVRKLRLRDYLANVWLPMLISLAMLGLIAALRNLGVGAHWPSGLRLIAFIAIGAAFYAAAALTFARPAVKATLAAARIILPIKWQTSRIVTVPTAIAVRLLSRMRASG